MMSTTNFLETDESVKERNLRICEPKNVDEYGLNKILGSNHNNLKAPPRDYKVVQPRPECEEVSISQKIHKNCPDSNPILPKESDQNMSCSKVTPINHCLSNNDFESRGVPSSENDLERKNLDEDDESTSLEMKFPIITNSSEATRNGVFPTKDINCNDLEWKNENSDQELESTSNQISPESETSSTNPGGVEQKSMQQRRDSAKSHSDLANLEKFFEFKKHFGDKFKALTFEEWYGFWTASCQEKPSCYCHSYEEQTDGKTSLNISQEDRIFLKNLLNEEGDDFPARFYQMFGISDTTKKQLEKSEKEDF